MALEGTHVRFALAIASRCGIGDFEAFCSGAVYPDTRYVSGIDRAKTHGLDCPHNPFTQNITDFERGWATHLLYDEFGGERLRSLFPPDIGPLGQDTKAWVEMTAMKIVEDMNSVQQMAHDREFVQNLSIQTSPCGESIESIRYHFAATMKLYKSSCLLEDYLTWFRDLHAPEEVVIAIRDRAEEMFLDPILCRKINAIFDDVLAKVLVR